MNFLYYKNFSEDKPTVSVGFKKKKLPPKKHQNRGAGTATGRFASQTPPKHNSPLCHHTYVYEILQ